MKPPNCLTETGIDDRPPRRQLERALAIAHEDLPLDHHVEEVLAALRDLAGLQRLHPSKSEYRR